MDHRLTCLTCGVRFAPQIVEGPGSDESYQAALTELKSHLKSDWHRYNLKRKVAELPAITKEAFTQKVLQHTAQVQKSQPEAFSGHCDVCHKTFASANSFATHVKSKKHLDMELRFNKRVEVKNELEAGEKETKQSEPEKEASDNEEMAEESDSEEWEGEGLGLEECLFCSHVSKTMEKNIAHMTAEHGFYIPDVEYVCDLEGLITYLGQLVGDLHLCLWCKSQRFRSTMAAQQHMVDKGHCKMMFEEEDVVEYSDFYDYRKSYPDYAGDDDEKDDGEEDEEVQLSTLVPSGYQLVLPSGAVVGHRALRRYFRQKLRPDRQIALCRDSSAVSKVISHYKALGWTGTTGVVAERKAKDIAFARRMQHRHFMRLGVRANRLQKHFRDQVFGF